MAAFKENIGVEAVDHIAEAMVAGTDTFPIDRFRALAIADLDQLELKARVRHVATALAATLPSSFTKAAAAMRRGVREIDLDGWPVWPCTDWVTLAGLDHTDRSLSLLAFLTSRWSSEFAIRPFLVADPTRVLATLADWCASPDEHVRRLVSEGTRPRLPWGERLVEFQREPHHTIPLLDRLYTDASDYVRRSVANHLNDISKDHPDAAVATAARWMVEGDEHTATLVRHGLRGLVKAGDPAALALLGYDHGAQVTVEAFTVSTPRVALGEVLAFEAVLSHAGDTPLPVVIDFAVHLVRAAGTRAPKVFKLTTTTLAPDEARTIVKRHPIKPVTVRRYYPGTHAIDLLVNGKVVATEQFELTVPPEP